MAIEQNDPEGIDSLLRRQEVNVDQVLKVYCTIWLVIFMFSFQLSETWNFGPIIETMKMNSTEVQNPRHKLDVFGSVLACAKSDHVFQKLSYSLCGPCLSLSSLYSTTLPQTVRLFDISLHSQAPQQQYTVLSFSSMRRHGHSHKLISSHALRYCTVGIPFCTSRK